MLNWYIVTRAQYDAGTPKENGLYFIQGENVIYRGSELYTRAIQFYTGEKPTTDRAPGRIYFNTETQTGSVFENGAWVDVIKPAEAVEVTVDGTVTADGTNAVSGKAVSDFVAAEIAKVLTNATWDPTEHMLTFPKGFTAEGDEPNEVNIVLDGMGVALQYNKTTGKLDLVDAKGAVLGEGVNLDLDRFVTSGEYDATNKKIILYFDAEKTDKVEIPVAEIMALSAVEGNALVMKGDGLYVATPDLTGLLAKPASTTAGNLAAFDADGNLIDAGKAVADLVTEAGGHAVYRGESLDAALTGHTPATDDIAIITTTTPAAEEGGEATTTTTTYSYDGTKWVVIATTASAGSVAPAPTIEIATTENVAASAATASDTKAASEKLVLTKYEELAGALEWKTEM